MNCRVMYRPHLDAGALEGPAIPPVFRHGIALKDIGKEQAEHQQRVECYQCPAGPSEAQFGTSQS